MKKYIGYGIGLLLFLILFCPWSRCQTVPPEVKQAIAASLRQSNTDGLHEEGGIWGTDISDRLVVIPAKPGKPHPVCMPGIVGIAPGDAADPSLDTNLKTILGEWHTHPRATKMRDHNSLCSISTSLHLLLILQMPWMTQTSSLGRAIRQCTITIRRASRLKFRGRSSSNYD